LLAYKDVGAWSLTLAKRKTHNYRMISLLRKSLGWIITFIVGLTFALTAIVLNKSAAADSTTGNSLPVWPLPHHTPPAVPEVNTGLVLLPIIFAVLLFASRQLLGKRVSGK
jgi:hypothetical protein